MGQWAFPSKLQKGWKSIRKITQRYRWSFRHLPLHYETSRSILWHTNRRRRLDCKNFVNFLTLAINITWLHDGFDFHYSNIILFYREIIMLMTSFGVNQNIKFIHNIKFILMTSFDVNRNIKSNRKVKFILRSSKEGWTEVSIFIADGMNTWSGLVINVKNFGWVREISNC